MKCSNCGEHINDTANFCKACGTKITRNLSDNTSQICRQCGSQGSATASFCPFCGTPFIQIAVSEDGREDSNITGRTIEETGAGLLTTYKVKAPRPTRSRQKPAADTADAPTPAKANPVATGRVKISKADRNPTGSASPNQTCKMGESSPMPTSVKVQGTAKKEINPQAKSPAGNRETSPAKASAATRKSSGLIKAVLLLGIVGVFLIQFIPGILPGKPPNQTSNAATDTALRAPKSLFPGISFTESELAAPGELVTVSPEVTRVETNGIIVDFGTYNLMAEGQLEVSRLPLKADLAAGVEITAYNFTLDEIKAGEEFAAMVGITMPYDPTGIAEANETTAFSAAGYDEVTNSWVLLPSTVDPDSNTITFQAAHFSIKAVLKNTLNQGTKLFYYEDGLYRGPNTKVLVDTGALNNQLSKIESNAFQKLIRDGSVPTNEMVSTGLGLTNILTSGADYSASLLDELQGTLMPALNPVTSSLKNKLLAVGIAATSLKVIDQYQRGVDSYKIFRDNILDALEIVVSGTAILSGSPWLVMVGAGIWAVGIYDQATYDPEDIAIYLNNLEKVYDEFTKRQAVYNLRTGEVRYLAAVPGQPQKKSPDEILLNSDAAWAHAMKSIYLQSKGEPQKIKARVDDLVRSVCNLFWSLYRRDPGTLYHWIDEESGLFPASAIAQRDLPWPKPEETTAFIEKMLDREVIRTHDRLQAVYSEMSEFEVNRLRLNYEESVLELGRAYNQTMTFELVDEALKEVGFGRSSLADKTFRFPVQSSLSDDFIITARPRDSNQVFTCTVYHYMMAGMPRELHMYPDEGDFALRDAQFSFEPTLPITRISLQGTPQVEVGVIEIDGPRVRSYDGHNTEMGGVDVDFTIYYRDGFPKGSRITFDFDDGGMVFSGFPEDGEKLPDGRWVMRDRKNYSRDGTYEMVIGLVDADGRLLGEDSITVQISGLWDGTYWTIPPGVIPEGDN